MGLLTRLLGRRVAILGAKGSGKSSLQKLLREGALPTTLESTTTFDQMSRGKTELGCRDKARKLTIRRGADVAGSDENGTHTGMWSKALRDVAAIIYLVRLDMLMDKPEYVAHLRTDGQVISRLLGASSGVKAVVAGTHADTLTLGDMSDKALTETQEFVTGHEGVQHLLNQLMSALPSRPPIVVGSLDSGPNAVALACGIVRNLDW